MPVTLTIKNVPEELAERLRAIAAAHHRSLQGELMAIIEMVGRLHDTGKVKTAFQELLTAPRNDDTSPAPALDTSDPADSDGLLDRLDAIVAGSEWGDAPILTRGQANDRSLSREFAYQIQEDEKRYKR